MHCQPAPSPLAVRYTTIGVYSKKFTDAFSLSINQAALAEVQAAAAATVYGERRFLLKELSNYAAAIVFQSWVASVSLPIILGEKISILHRLDWATTKKLSNKIDIGVPFNYNMIKLTGYGSSSTVNFEGGMIIHFTDKIHAGIHVYNPVGGKFGNSKTEKLAAIYASSTGYEVSGYIFYQHGK